MSQRVASQDICILGHSALGRIFNFHLNVRSRYYLHYIYRDGLAVGFLICNLCTVADQHIAANTLGPKVTLLTLAECNVSPHF